MTNYAVNHSVLQFGSQGLAQAMPNGTSNVVLLGQKAMSQDQYADAPSTGGDTNVKPNVDSGDWKSLKSAETAVIVIDGRVR